MMRSSFVLLAALALGGTGCGPNGSALPGAPFVADVSAASLGLDVRMTRRWSDYYGTTPMTVTERVVEAANGSWSVDLLTLNGKELAAITEPAAQKEFMRLDRLLDLGRGRYAIRGRDFAIRNWDLFVANYEWSLISSDTSVAGRPVYVADVWAKQSGRPRYTVWVDQETMQTMKCLEFLPSGELAAEMEVLTIEWDPDLTNVDLKPGQLLKANVDPNSFPSLVPFQTFHLAYVPAGFAPISAQLSSLAGKPVLQQTYSDGVQDLSFWQAAELDPAPLPAEIAADAPVSVRMTAEGAQTQATFVLLGTQLYVNSKLTPDESMNVVESVTPNP